MIKPRLLGFNRKVTSSGSQYFRGTRYNRNSTVEAGGSGTSSRKVSCKWLDTHCEEYSTNNRKAHSPKTATAAKRQKNYK